MIDAVAIAVDDRVLETESIDEEPDEGAASRARSVGQTWGAGGYHSCGDPGTRPSRLDWMFRNSCASQDAGLHPASARNSGAHLPALGCAASPSTLSTDYLALRGRRRGVGPHGRPGRVFRLWSTYTGVVDDVVVVVGALDTRGRLCRRAHRGMPAGTAAPGGWTPISQRAYQGRQVAECLFPEP